MAGNYLKKSRHGTKYYFRRRIPDDLRLAFGLNYLTHSLATDSRTCAVRLARAAAAETDTLYEQIRNMADDKDPSKVVQLSDLITHWKHKHALETQLEESETRLESLRLQHLQEIVTLRSKAREAVLKAHVLGSTNSARNAPKLPESQQLLPSPPKGKGKSLTDVWKAYSAEKIALGKQTDVTGGWKDGEDTALRDYWPHVRAFINLIGDKDITLVTADDAERFKNHILTSEEGGSARNREKCLQRAGGLFRWAKGKRYIKDAFEEFFRYPGKIAENHRLKFDAKDLVAPFESDDYKTYSFKTPSEYWLPVLGLFTGARLNELCQLTISDIGEHDGVDTISILDEEEGKRLKTTASRRIVPIHSKLMEIGFLNHVATITEGRIFPELPEDPARPGNFGPKASESFTAYRRKCSVGSTEGRSKKVFHSFRTTLIGALRKANVPKDRRTRLAGHEYKDTQDKEYDGGDVLTMFDTNTLKADIECVKFDVDFTPYRII